ncbi:hypothetical protein [Methylovirgula sp. 4M-Z18]|uniref:hypothetical protein n=1 Tax=Methylovirgula sp. 4M-Z18 TaxID=2293567 RepID=UPI000E2FEBAB|nr:hypothetical protein [Methylovirgula sp. 4M-Z18]RFB81317.1 hypothetical protein DYH55_07735 [Methylovirgula sp. 4M-Z18]
MLRCLFACFLALTGTVVRAQDSGGTQTWTAHCPDLPAQPLSGASGSVPVSVTDNLSAGQVHEELKLSFSGGPEVSFTISKDQPTVVRAMNFPHEGTYNFIVSGATTFSGDESVEALRNRQMKALGFGRITISRQGHMELLYNYDPGAPNQITACLKFIESLSYQRSRRVTVGSFLHFSPFQGGSEK